MLKEKQLKYVKFDIKNIRGKSKRVEILYAKFNCYQHIIHHYTSKIFYAILVVTTMQKLPFIKVLEVLMRAIRQVKENKASK